MDIPAFGAESGAITTRALVVEDHNEADEAHEMPTGLPAVKVHDSDTNICVEDNLRTYQV